MNSLRFEVHCQVEFGQTVGVISDRFEDIFPLQWSEGHLWKGELLLPITYSSLTCKFIIFHESQTKVNSNNTTCYSPESASDLSQQYLNQLSPSIEIIDTEVGPMRHYNLLNQLQFPTNQVNRLMRKQQQQQQQQQQYEIRESFNKRRIEIAVYAEPNSSMFVRGNIAPLEQPQKLTQVDLSNSLSEQDSDTTDSPISSPSSFSSSSTASLTHSNRNTHSLSLYKQEFQIDMKAESLRYFFIRNMSQVERGVGRYLLFNSNVSKPTAVQYAHARVDTFNANLDFNVITDSLIVGSFINCEEDIATLVSQGVTAIVSLQTESDMHRKYVNVQDIRRCAKSKGILYVNIPIRDKDPAQFIDRVPEALNSLAKLALAKHKIYLHCTAGISRAPQTAILHLILNLNISFSEASKLVFQKRPVASPNLDAIISVLQNMDHDFEES